MDAFGVPKKVNRHVLKAMFYFAEVGHKTTSIKEIEDFVAFSMRNVIPVPNLAQVIQQSLTNLINAGLLERRSNGFRINTPERFNVSNAKAKKNNGFKDQSKKEENDGQAENSEKSKSRSGPKLKISKPQIAVKKLALNPITLCRTLGHTLKEYMADKPPTSENNSQLFTTDARGNVTVQCFDIIDEDHPAESSPSQPVATNFFSNILERSSSIPHATRRASNQQYPLGTIFSNQLDPQCEMTFSPGQQILQLMDVLPNVEDFDSAEDELSYQESVP